MAITVKFGGVVLDSAENILKAANEVLSIKEKTIVVVSASRGVTNRLENIATTALQGFRESEELINSLQNYHFSIAIELGIIDECKQEFESYKSKLIDIAKGLSIVGELSDRTLDLVVHFGEKYSSKLFYSLLIKLTTKASKPVCGYLAATDFLITDETHRFATPNTTLTKERIDNLLTPAMEHSDLIVTEGYISKGANGQITTMGRESSDFSATLIAELSNCSEARIYTNVAGVYTADPEVIPNAKKLDFISYSTAQEMAALGAKVLHPRTVAPIVRANIPLIIKSIGNSGTIIHNENISRFYAISTIPQATLIDIQFFNTRGKTDKIFEKIYKYVPVLFSIRQRKHLKIACSLGLQELNIDTPENQIKKLDLTSGSIVSIISTQEISPSDLKNIFKIVETVYKEIEPEDVVIPKALQKFITYHSENSVSIFIALEYAKILALRLHEFFVE